MFTDCLRRFEASASKAAMMGMFKINPATVKTGKNEHGKNEEEYCTNPVADAMIKIAPAGKTVQRKISSFLLDSQIVSTATKKRSEKVKAAEKAADKAGDKAAEKADDKAAESA